MVFSIKSNPLFETILVVVIMVLCSLGPYFNLKPSKWYDGPQIGLIYIGIAKLKFGLL